MASILAKILHAYQNGNCFVTLLEDGTKTREYDGDPKPIFPESVDLKITDYCDAGCGYCHEQSTKKGEHASVNAIMRLVEGLPRGVEIAIGGGDPLSHPEILDILLEFKSRGLISNITVNAVHVGVHTKFIKDLRDLDLMFGLGVSYVPGIDFSHIVDSRTLVHLIAGAHQVSELTNIPTTWPLLILGYKFYGRGIRFAEQQAVYENLKKWRFWIGKAMNERNISFDALGLNQLKIKEWVTEDVWNTCYMGNEGEYSMYVDAVAHTYGVSSTAPRKPLRALTIPKAFTELQTYLKTTPIVVV